MMLKYLPNFFTTARLLLIVPFLYFIQNANYPNAFYIFLTAGFTDGLDGWLARHFNWQSRLGSFLDPIADKLLITSSFISLAYLHLLPWWLVILVLLRDISISLGVLAWYRFIQRRLDFTPTLMSKINTVLQLALVTLCLFELAFSQETPMITSLLILFTTITTTATYIDYALTWKKAYGTAAQTP